MNRRQWLASMSTVGVAGAAGCTSILGPSGSPEDVTREYYETLGGVEEGTTNEEYLDKLESILHSEVWEEAKEDYEEDDALDEEVPEDMIESEIDEFETIEVIDEDIDPDTAEEEFSDDSIEVIPDGDLEENAVVEVEILLESDDEPSTEFTLIVAESGTIRDDWQLASITVNYDG